MLFVSVGIKYSCCVYHESPEIKFPSLWDDHLLSFNQIRQSNFKMFCLNHKSRLDGYILERFKSNSRD